MDKENTLSADTVKKIFNDCGLEVIPKGSKIPDGYVPVEFTVEELFKDFRLNEEK